MKGIGITDWQTNCWHIGLSADLFKVILVTIRPGRCTNAKSCMAHNGNDLHGNDGTQSHTLIA